MLYALAIVLGILRWVPRASALFRWLPSRLQWLPSAVVAAAGVLAARLGWGPDALSGVIPAQWLQLADASLEAVVGFVLAAQAGMHPPPAINVTVAPLPKSVSLLFFGILSVGCCEKPAPCSPEEVQSIVDVCTASIAAMPDDDDAILEANVCRATVRAWRDRCGS